MRTGKRDRGNRRVLTAEEAAMVDWKRFHRVVSDRDQAGRHHFLYQLPANNQSRNGVYVLESLLFRSLTSLIHYSLIHMFPTVYFIHILVYTLTHSQIFYELSILLI